MRYRKLFSITLLMVLLAGLPATVQCTENESGLQKAKLMLFDKQWRKALAQLNRVLQQDPADSQALFYKARCQEELKEDAAALQTYRMFLRRGKNPSLHEEANVAIVDLAFSLYSKGEKGYAREIVSRLNSSILPVRYYAALKLSYVKKLSLAEKAVPVLKNMMESESDEELVDRAKIALLRIDPHLLKKSVRAAAENAMLKIRITEKSTRRDSVSITIPFALARLALEALPAESREYLKAKGYSLKKIIDSLQKSGDIIRIDGEEQIFRIWLDNR